MILNYHLISNSNTDDMASLEEFYCSLIIRALHMPFIFLLLSCFMSCTTFMFMNFHRWWSLDDVMNLSMFRWWWWTWVCSHDELSYFCIISYCSVLKCCQMNWKRENRENKKNKKNYAYGKAIGIYTPRSYQGLPRGTSMPTAKP